MNDGQSSRGTHVDGDGAGSVADGTSVPFRIHRDGRVYVLDYVYDSEQRARTAADARSPPTVHTALPLDGRAYGLYTAPAVEAESIAALDLTELSETERSIVRTILTIFDVIDTETDLAWSGSFDPTALAAAVNRVDWGESVRTVGGQLLTEVILSEGLPAASHPTAIALLDAYLQTVTPSFDAPAKTGADGWVDWVDSYIADSTRLQLLANNARFVAWLADRGATAIECREGIVLHLEEYPLEQADPAAEYKQQHGARSEAFVATYLQASDATSLGSRQDPGRQSFANHL